MLRILLLVLFAALMACAGQVAPIDPLPSPAPRGVDDASPGAAQDDASDPAARAQAPDELLSPYVVVEELLPVDPTGKPDQIWAGHVVCPTAPPVTCACDFSGGPILKSYVSYPRACECEARAHVKGVLHTYAICER